MVPKVVGSSPTGRPNKTKKAALKAAFIVKKYIFAVVKNRPFLLAFLVIATLFVACNKKQLTPKPDHLIPFNQMVEIMAESYLIESMIYFLPPDSDKIVITQTLYNDLFVKNNISKNQYNSSIKYYLADKISAEKLLNAVSDQIATKRKKYFPETENKPIDDSPNR